MDLFAIVMCFTLHSYSASLIWVFYNNNVFSFTVVNCFTDLGLFMIVMCFSLQCTMLHSCGFVYNNTVF
jgi:hypothetical protein